MKRRNLLHTVGIISMLIIPGYFLPAPDAQADIFFHEFIFPIALAFAAAYLFFILQVVLPERKSEKDAEQTLSKSILDLTSYFCDYEGVLDLLISQNGIRKDILHDGVLYYKLDKATDGSYLASLFNIKTDFDLLQLNMNKKIDRIRAKPEYINLNYTTRDLLITIQLNRFFEHAHANSLLNSSRFSFTDLQNEFNELKSAVTNLAEHLSLSPPHYNFKILTQSETMLFLSQYEKISDADKEIVRAFSIPYMKL